MNLEHAPQLSGTPVRLPSGGAFCVFARMRASIAGVRIVGDLRATPLNAADAVLANLTGGLLIAAADRLLQLVAPGGHLVISGFQDHDEQAVRAAFAALTVEWRGDEDGWVCLQLVSRI